MKHLAWLVGVVMVACLVAPTLAEDWAGLEGGGLRHNASSVDVQPQALKKLWQRSFAPLPIGDQEGPNNEMDFAAGKGAWNLTLLDGRIALIASEHVDVPNEVNDYYCTVLDAADGDTLNCVCIKSSQGNTRAYRWPHYCVSASGDNISGIVQIAWDPQSRILFVAQGAYPSSYTAWLPLANIGTYGGTFHDAVPAYEQLAAEHPAFADVFGRRRSEMQTVFGPDVKLRPMQPYTWGLSGFYASQAVTSEGKPVKYDEDWETVFGRQGSSYYNTSSHFDLDCDGALIVQNKGADWGHNSSGDAYLFNKHTGMKAVADWPNDGDRRLRPFTVQGTIVGNHRVFSAGPSEGRLGVARPEGNVPKRDQGLYLWAYDVAFSDEQHNDGFAGPGAAETATLTPAFVHRFESRFTPDRDDIQSYGQSYYECDGFYRNKAMLVDGRSVWFAWKPSAADPAELIHADDDGAVIYSLDVGRGLYGVDLWPKISLSEISNRKRVTYFTGYAKHRTRFMPDDVEAALHAMHREGDSPLTEEEIEKTKQHAAQAGIWHGELQPPRGPAELVVFDADAGTVRWKYNVSENYPSLPANEFWTYLDKTAMVVAGRWAYVGWVDVTADEAVLRLLGFDITADEPQPIPKAISLGFTSSENRRSALFDLIAVDGTLYALVTQSDRLWIRDPRWKVQHVIALSEFENTTP